MESTYQFFIIIYADTLYFNTFSYHINIPYLIFVSFYWSKEMQPKYEQLGTYK